MGKVPRSGMSLQGKAVSQHLLDAGHGEARYLARPRSSSWRHHFSFTIEVRGVESSDLLQVTLNAERLLSLVFLFLFDRQSHK